MPRPVPRLGTDEKAKITRPTRRRAARDAGGMPTREHGRLRPHTRSAVREPGASPGRSRRCEGRRSPATTPLAPRDRAGKAVGEGAPSQKTCRLRHSLEPLAEGRRRVQRMSRRLAVAAISCSSVALARPPSRSRQRPRRPHRRRRRSRRRRFPATVTAFNGKVTVASDRPGSSRSRRRRPRRCSRSAPARRSSPSTTSPTTRRRRRARRSRATRRTSRRSSAFRPDLVVISYDPKGLSEALGRLGIPVLHHNAARRRSPGAYQQMRQLGAAHRARAGGRPPDRAHEDADRRDRQACEADVGSARRSSSSSTRRSTRRPRPRSSGAWPRCSGCSNIADPAEGTSGGYPQLSAEYVISADPDVILLADTVCCGQGPKTVAARAGWSNISAITLRLGDPHRRLDRLAVGAAPREPRPRPRRRR